MLILGKDTMKDPSLGYARTFVRQLEDCLGLALEQRREDRQQRRRAQPRRPRRPAPRGRERARPRPGDRPRRGRRPARRSAVRDGALTANAYLGGFGIAAALRRGRRRRRHRPGHRRLAGGRARRRPLRLDARRRTTSWPAPSSPARARVRHPGHRRQLLRLPRRCRTTAPPLGFPLAEIAADGSQRDHQARRHRRRGHGRHRHRAAGLRDPVHAATSAPTSPPASTRSQLRPGRPGPGRDHAASAARPPPEQLKVCVNELGGFRNTVEFVLTGLDIEAKADWVRDAARRRALAAARSVDLVPHRPRRTPTPTPRRARPACSGARSRTRRPTRSASAFTAAAVELALASYPGFTMTAPPGRRTPYGVYRAGVRRPRRRSRTPSSTPTAAARSIADPTGSPSRTPDDAGGRPSPYPAPAGRRSPGGCRSARSCTPAPATRAATPTSGCGSPTTARDKYAARVTWLSKLITRDKVRELLPEAADLEVEVYLLPNLGARQRGDPRPARRGRRRVAPGSTRRPRRWASGCARGWSRSQEALL